MNATVAAGGTLTLIPRFDPHAALEIIERDGVNIFMGVPTMYGALLHEPDRESFDTSGAEAVRVGRLGDASRAAARLRGGVRLQDPRGLRARRRPRPSPSFNHPDRERKPGSIGTPIEGVEMKVVDDEDNEVPQGEVGEIVIRGHNVMKGYWQRPDATAEAIRDGWFHSGDMAHGRRGRLLLHRRPQEGHDHPRRLQRLPARDRRGASTSTPRCARRRWSASRTTSSARRSAPRSCSRTAPIATADELRDFVKEQVAAYKYPRRVWFVDELPKGPTGKILKREIEPPPAA